MTPHSVIFDLDGVVVDTAVYHHAAWRVIAQELGFDLSDAVGERLKGVGRLDALHILLSIGGVQLGDADQRALAEKKNARYVEMIDRLGPGDVLPGARELLDTLRQRHVPTALASASKNARRILDLLQLEELFDVIVDGTDVSAPKPDPQVFLTAAERLGLPPRRCLVFEDAIAGIDAAKAAGMTAVGVGDPRVLTRADVVIANLSEAQPLIDQWA